ncbi:WXG100 family type VII secretion target [Mycolicibacterium sp. CR10]|uniref:WXG100 family type VII secretion target n=1 Tax=Mycolicibacterium sp. CR10 TaxID=2562314 RepID=UPI0010BF737D|nr:WXG100 family type VII secretion target [Mycolicibacterium sp. CR10]
MEASRPGGLSESAAQLVDKLAQLDQTIASQHHAMRQLRGAWQGRGADAALSRARRDLAAQRQLRGRLGAVQSALTSAGSQLSSIRSAIVAIVEGLRARGWQVTDIGAAIAPPSPAILKSLEGAFTSIVQRLLDMFEHADTATAAAITVAMQPSAAESSGTASYSFGPGGAPQAPQTEQDDERRRHQIDAFKAATGRVPVTENDWRTAAMLDPHNYSDKNHGVQSNVVVGQINPVPGQGAVQTNLFIPGEEAWYPDLTGGISGHNLGDNRGFNPNAGPEDSRVVSYVDYENGLVVARQNPSIDTRSGEIKVGTPHVNVSQNPDGAVLIDYKAADPFSPGGEELALDSPFNVNGQMVIKPTGDGPIAGGIVSSFPAIEIYSHGAEGTSEIAKIMPQNITQAGPLAGLPFSQNIGVPLMGEFPDTVLPPMPGIPDLDLAPGQDLPVLQPTPPFVIPYPSIELGPVGDDVNIPVGK